MFSNLELRGSSLVAAGWRVENSFVFEDICSEPQVNFPPESDSEPELELEE